MARPRTLAAAAALAALLLVAAGCRAPAGRVLGGPAISRGQATEMAIQFMADLPWAAHWESEPHAVIDEGSQWAARFGKLDGDRREIGVVTVHKRFGTTRWRLDHQT